MEACETAKSVLTNTAAVDREMDRLRQEMEVITGLIKKCIDENSSKAMDQEEYTSRYNGFVDRYETVKKRYDELADERKEKLKKAKAILSKETLIKSECAREREIFSSDCAKKPPLC